MKNIQIGAALKTMRKNRGWTIHDRSCTAE